ncbi:MAG: crossover junction endodeoxyribonuclease RuvC [Phycisphaerales bacterium]|nr:crossover junction endodeoxyribonuclease RuvC [Phycisphaerales bacterium]
MRLKEVAMRILGIDPGLQLTGYALVSVVRMQPRLEEAGVIRLARHKDIAPRLEELHRQVAELLGEYACDRVAVEQLYAHYKHPATAILMGHARGVILLAAQQAGVAVVNMPSTLVKKTITGNGHASKSQIQRSVAALCKLAKPPSPPDVADAIAIAWTLARQLPTAGRRSGRWV